MNIILNIVVFILCGALVYQDFRERKISVWVLIALFLTLCFQSALSNSVFGGILRLALNTSYIFILFTLLTLYFSVKEKKPVNIIDSYIGLGDFLFLLALTPAFSLPAFMLFTTAGLFLSMLVYVLIFILRKDKPQDIPLAGCLAGVFSLFVLLQACGGETQFQNHNLISHISYLITCPELVEGSHI